MLPLIPLKLLIKAEIVILFPLQIGKQEVRELDYTSNAYVSFVGGGGKGAQGIAHVHNGSVQSITLTNPGNGYESAPKVFVHSGGWRSFGAGNSPYNDVLIPAGSGIHLFRNLPNGLASILRVGNPLE